MPRTPGKALADVRHAIIRKIRAMRKAQTTSEAWGALDELAGWVQQMDERALTRKGGTVRPWRPLHKIPGTGLKKKARKA